MPLTLKTYNKELTKELLLLAEKNTVRECDETSKGHFVAYVDEGSVSFDVSLVILPNAEIGDSTCDCKNNTAFCKHKAALLIHIAADKKISTPVKIKKKEDKVATLLEQVELTDLKDWVRNLIEKNKDIELAFNHHFSTKKQQYLPEEVVKIIKDAIKATVGNKKTIDATQIKKLVELWSDVLKPVIENYHSGVMDEKAFQSFHAIIEYCLQFNASINSGSGRIAKFIDDTLRAAEAPVNNLLNDEAWRKATGFFIDHVPDPAYNDVRLHYLQHLQNILNVSNAERKDHLIKSLTEQFKKSKPEKIINWARYTKSIFAIIKAYGLFQEYYTLFNPLHFENDFNQNLIGLLIENNHLDRAKGFCEYVVKSNYKEEYSIPYLKFLKEIFTIEKDEQGLVKVITVLFPYSYDFDDYLFIIKGMTTDEAKTWRTKTLSKARNSSRGGNYNALAFCFQLMNYEGNYKKMIEYIDSYTPYPVILKYFEPMLSGNKDNLLKAIINKSEDGWSFSGRAEKEKSCFPELFDMVEKYFTADYLRLVIKAHEKGRVFLSRSTGFLAYMKDRLNIGATK